MEDIKQEMTPHIRQISSDEVINGAKNEFFKTGFWRECNTGLPDG
jgi:hypothetical protein